VIDRLRVAAGQFAATQDLDENLASCLRLIDNAIAAEVDLLVLPEFSNHISVYRDQDHCRAVALSLDGEWLGSIARRARAGGLHVAVTVTTPRHDEVTVTSVLIDDLGTVIAAVPKQTLMGNERAHLVGGDCVNDLAQTRFGPIGLYACMDGVTFEMPRSYAVRGARLLTNSLNSFALDEAALHIPVRAVENGVFVVAANKVGPLLPVEQVDVFSEALGIPPTALDGAGESQIVGPDGTILAKASRTGEAVVWADVDLGAVDHGRLVGRRPALYAPLGQSRSNVPSGNVPEDVVVAAITSAEQAVDAMADGVQLVVLAEGVAPPEAIPDGVYLMSTAVDRGIRTASVWSSRGVVHEQRQIHSSSAAADDADLAGELSLWDSPFGTVALFVGDDHLFPEAFRLAAIEGAHIALVSYEPTNWWESDLGIRERAAENRLCLVACSSSEHDVASMILNPPLDSLWSPQRSSEYDGTINTPERVRSPDGGPVLGSLHPIRALAREISKNTDLVGGRSWRASAPLVS